MTQAALPQTQRSELLALFKAGRYAELEVLAQSLLAQYPNDLLVWKSIGAALLKQGKNALDALQVTTRLAPGDAAEHCNLAAALLDAGRVQEAAVSCRRALQIQPEMAQAHGNLGNALRQLGHLDEAVASYLTALQLQPDAAQIHYNLGVVLRQQGKIDHAASSFQRASILAPGSAAAHEQLANTLRTLGRPDEALAAFRRALAIDPDSARIHNDLANLLRELGRLDEALDCYDRALRLQPQLAELHNNRATVLRACGRLDEAERALRHALALKPQFAEAYCNLGDVLRDARRIGEAVGHYRKALEIKPDFAIAHNNLAVVCRDLGELAQSLASSRRAIEIQPDYLNAHSNLLLTANYLVHPHDGSLLRQAMDYGAVARSRAQPYVQWPNLPDATRALRVGLVSGDMQQHPVGYFLDSVVAAAATQCANRLNFVAYATRPSTDALTERLKKNCNAWREVAGWPDRKLAQCVREDAIDILIDLSGHTAHNRLPMFAWKPAPIQVSWLGYFATTGMAEIDYVLADPWTAPPGSERDFVESIWRLPETRLCFTPPQEQVEVAPLPAMKNGSVTFGCFGNLTKMNDEVIALWAKVLHAIEGSRLLLKAKQLDEQSARSHVLARFARHGIDAARLSFDGYTTRSDYLASYAKVDIVLDTFPFPGGTTTAEALWMGVPVLTLAGESFVSRQGVGLLMNARLAQWIASDPEQFVALAVKYAGDLPRLAALRAMLRQQVQAAPLFDAARFAVNFEAALRGMWQRWCAQQAAPPGV
jgi:predicted O-linked N-acetylglucosamine transferase (SPINDLY family)